MTASKNKAPSIIQEDVVKVLKKKVLELSKEVLSADIIRQEILKINNKKLYVPQWMHERPKKVVCPGVPSLACSDVHFGEKVLPKSIGGLNRYDTAIAETRLNTMIDTTANLLHNHIKGGQYPGIVFPLIGDLLSGDIHDELIQTNDMPTLNALYKLHGILIKCITELQKAFGKVFVPCVTGNHSRTTHKIQHKHRIYTNYEWLLYVMLERHFQDNPSVTFLVSEGIDAYYRIYNHRYLMTHGDQFKATDSIIGALGPLIRGDMKFRSRSSQTGRPYDTLLVAHFHQLIQMQRLICNASVVGFSEYSYDLGFPYEPPRQACWITHYENGITFQIPINLEPPKKQSNKAKWVSVWE